MSDDRSEVASFYRVAAWKKGQRVQHVDDPEKVGMIVQRGATMWVDRDRKLPFVRWDGKVDSEEVHWTKLVEQAPRREAERNKRHIEHEKAKRKTTAMRFAVAVAQLMARDRAQEGTVPYEAAHGEMTEAVRDVSDDLGIPTQVIMERVERARQHAWTHIDQLSRWEGEVD